MATTTTSNLSNNIDTVLSKAIDMHLYPSLVFSRLAIENGKQHDSAATAQKGDPVKFTLYNSLPYNTSTLSETPNSETAQTISNTQVTVTLLEKGDYVATTRKLSTLSFDGLVDVAKLVAVQAQTSTDVYAMEVAETQSGASYNTYVGNTAKSGIDETDVLTADVVRETYNKLERNNVPKVRTEGGEYYLWITSSDPILDLKKEGSTTKTTFREASLYANPQEILRGEIGAFEGFRFINTNLAKMDFGAGAQTASTTTAASAVAGATTFTLTSATNFTTDAGVLEVTVSGVKWGLEISGIASTTVTVNKAITKNGFFYPARDGSGLPVALAGGEAVVEKHTVYSNYAMGADAFAYAYAVKPTVIRTNADDPFNRLERIAWYALHGIAEYRPESLHKVYCGSSVDKNK